MKSRSTALAMTSVALGALVFASACGSSVVDQAEPAASAGESPLPADSPAADAEYGATLDEFLDGDAQEDRPEQAGDTATPAGFAELVWDDLVPPGMTDAEISARFEERIAEVEPGTPEADEVYSELQAEFDNRPINPDAAREDIYLAGFVAPLTYDGDLVTEFLLVPYFGACIHVPPPPPNQTVLVTLAEGQSLTVEESWGAVWVAGSLVVDEASTDLADAGYLIEGATVGIYDEY